MNTTRPCSPSRPRMVAMRLTFTLLALAAWPLAGLAQTCPTGNPRVAPDGRYVISEPVPGEQVVRDLETGLMWKRCLEGQAGAACTNGPSFGQQTWSLALSLARSSTWAGFDDWRVPNLEELISLVETGCHSPALNTTVFPNGAGFVWSSTTVPSNLAQAQRVFFVQEGQTWPALKGTPSATRLVRGGGALDHFDSGGLIFRNGFE